ncbi:hypothetical protein FKM82_030655 [Ascaphus truei]
MCTWKKPEGLNLGRQTGVQASPSLKELEEVTRLKSRWRSMGCRNCSFLLTRLTSRFLDIRIEKTRLLPLACWRLEQAASRIPGTRGRQRTAPRRKLGSVSIRSSRLSAMRSEPESRRRRS